MRLKKIKLAGFKSFADPTEIVLASNLLAIVGPNGCGKSNIIDAVRWVLGGSARHLRADTGADVIFNGSGDRKPVGQASVELIFDNGDGAIGGEYANYSEIAVKRVVNREGQSSYHLNGAHCRRRDIVAIFLGTGLGPRSYAIIEQGMITRLVEAKPEELRQFLEEAAGISKYKERRRETENRIKHTRENLLRINDIREELNSQLSRLQKQANAAQKYQVLRSEEGVLQAQLGALQWRSYQQELAQQSLEVKRHQVILEEGLANQTSLEKELEQHHQRHIEVSEAQQSVQAAYYRFGSEIVRLEEAIQNQRVQCQACEQDLQQVQTEQTTVETRYQQDQNNYQNLKDQMDALDNEQQATQTQFSESQGIWTQAEQAYSDWRQQWESFQQENMQVSQRVNVKQTQIEHLQQRLEQLKNDMARLQREKSEQNNEAVARECESLQAQQQQISQRLTAAKEILAALEAQLTDQREHKETVLMQLDRVKGDLQQQLARQTSLQTLQQAALDDQNEAVNVWLNQQQLKSNLRLAQYLQVESGWEIAVENVLGGYLQAMCVADLGKFSQKISQLSSGQLTLIEGGESVNQNASNDLLLSKIKNGSLALSALLKNVYVADSYAQAQQSLASLPSDATIVTRDGVYLGKHFVRIMHSQDEQGGVIARERELRELTQTIITLENSKNALSEDLSKLNQALQTVEDKVNQQQEIVADLSMQSVDTKAQLNNKKERLIDLQDRARIIDETLSAQQTQYTSMRDDLRLAQAKHQQAQQTLSDDGPRREILQQKRNQIEQKLQVIKQQVEAHRQQQQTVVIKAQTAKAQKEALDQTMQRDQQQLQQLSQRQADLKETLSGSDDRQTTLNEQLQQQLSQQKAVENELTQVKNQSSELEQVRTELTQQSQQIQQQVQQVREQIQQLNLEEQSLRVRMATIEEEFEKQDTVLQTVLGTLPEAADPQVWQDDLQKVNNRISRLGAINLAAIEECQIASERKIYLDSQFEDLSEALTTLETAIAKIDKETTSRFQQTFDLVNGHLETLFARLFAGGKACLSLTGSDILTSGVTIVASPPGKKNHSINMLSGGEKTLTALALVFAIFQLNPAPFCLLDEVDAPLDDNNVQRFCELVKEMSNTVQFIIISHNKVTMALAHHLAGVTMREAGVSRLVSVDIDKAVSFAQARKAA
ncbi:MAG: chromosome segregation protein SMC [Gammaproteobacteria bacterium]